MITPLYSLYIHWPFCTSKCYYCDFVAFEQHEDFQNRYHHALIKEIQHFARNMSEVDRNITTIFIGGGTPSLYPLPLMEELFSTLRQHFNFATIKEISIETNPADITEEKLDMWHFFGINRISMGVQILDDDVLLKLNRRQRTADVMKSLSIIPKYFDNFSVDFIVGLPGVSEATWHTSIDTVLTNNPPHISMYFLTIHEKTPLYFKVSRGEMTLPNEDKLIATYEKTVQKLADAGIEQYETSNFSKPGFASMHNKAYWDRKPYKGLGIGSSSFDGKHRLVNENNLVHYMEKIEQNKFDSLSTRETLTNEQERLEILMLSLRQKQGLALRELQNLMPQADKKKISETLEQLTAQALLEESNGNLSLTLKGMLLENEVVLKLL